MPETVVGMCRVSPVGGQALSLERQRTGKGDTGAGEMPGNALPLRHLSPSVCHMSGVRVLVVEDDDGIGTALVRGLEREGYDTVRVSTAADAERAEPADVVIL